MEKIDHQLMLKNDLNKRALISFFIFIIIVLKDFLVSYLGIIPERGSLNRTISWSFILPISLLGIIFSIQVINENFKRLKEGRRFIDISFIISLPCLFYCMFYVIIFLIGSI